MRVMLAALVIFWFSTDPAASQGGIDLRAGLKLYEAGRCKEANERFSAALDSKWLSPAQRGVAFAMRGICHIELGDHKAARADVDQAIGLVEDPGPTLALRAALAWRMDDHDQAVKDVLRVAREFPHALPGVEPQVVWALWRWLRDEGRTEDQFGLLEAVVTAGYEPGNPAQRADGLVSEYMGSLIDRGKADAALPMVEKIIDAHELIEMRASGRFKPLWNKPAFDRRTEPLTAARRERDYWKTQAAEHPESLHIVHNRMQILRMLGDLESAKALGQAAMTKLESFRDKDEYEPWIRNELAYIHQDAGRVKDAKAVMQPLLERSVKDDPSLVSQFINYGIIVMNGGDPEGALAAVDKAKGRVSPYGQKWIDSTEVCAYHRLGRSNDAEAGLKRLKTKPEENYAALSRALLCLDRIDEAVQLALVRLRDPDHRDAMVMNLQGFRERSGLAPPRQELLDRWDKVRRHPDVVAEANKHGRILDIPLFSTYWGDV